MNAVEIEQAVTDLAAQPFDRAEFPYAFLEAFGNKDAGIRRLRAGETNKSDLGGVLQQKNIHILVAPTGEVSATLNRLRTSERNQRWKVRYLLATDGVDFEAEDLESGDVVACAYQDFPDHFGFFLPLAGITTVRQIQENAFDIRATSRLNRLYVELLRENPDWAGSERRHEMNHFMARLIFCFFAEDTNIFNGQRLFTATVDTMSDRDASNTHEVVSEIFRAMNVKPQDRAAQKVARWADAFPYVNGGLFSGSTEVPRFSKIARSYLVQVGNLDWTKINPDIFGSMIQAVADDEERGALGMHYTSVPNILKVLNPLFLEDLRAQLDAIGDNSRQLLNLRKRLSKIRVFDPACGSGNFLVIAYKQMREIEAIINERRGEKGRKSEIPLTNFRGIELRDFPAEIARLALIIAEYQCDLLYRGQQEALAEFLPLESQNWITCGNALRLDWLTLCRPIGTEAVASGGDLFSIREELPGFENEGGETYICGNPPYLGSKWQPEEQKKDLEYVFGNAVQGWKSLDYVSAWFYKAAEYGKQFDVAFAFVSTNSICQGIQVSALWPSVFKLGYYINFAYPSFKWSNLAANNAGVIVSIIGVAKKTNGVRRLFDAGDDGKLVARVIPCISPYLVAGKEYIVEPSKTPISSLHPMLFGNMPRDGGNLILEQDEFDLVKKLYPEILNVVRPYMGSEQMIQGKPRWCIWVDEPDLEKFKDHPYLKNRFEKVRAFRQSSAAPSTREFSSRPYRFVQIAGIAKSHSLVVAKVSSENRSYIPVDLIDGRVIVSDLLFALYDAPIWHLSMIASRLHLVWIATVCGKLKNDFRYSNTLGWNTFPIPRLTEKNIQDLTESAHGILLARESHYPKTLADLYAPECMPPNLREAHDRNDEVVERIFVGRRFKNDTERIEKLFELYANTYSGRMKPRIPK